MVRTCSANGISSPWRDLAKPQPFNLSSGSDNERPVSNSNRCHIHSRELGKLQEQSLQVRNSQKSATSRVRHEPPEINDLRSRKSCMSLFDTLPAFARPACVYGC